MRLSLALAAAVVWTAAGTANGQWTFAEEAKLIPSISAPGEWAGASVALEGDTAVVGVPHRDQGFGTFSSIRGLAFDTGGQMLHGVDEAAWRLVSITATGLANQVGTTQVIPAAGMAFDPGLGVFYVGNDWSLWQVTTNGVVTASWFTTSGVVGLAFDPGSQTLYGSASDRLVTIAPVAGTFYLTPVEIGPFGFTDVQGLEFDAASGMLYGTDCATDQLLAIDPSTGAASAIGPLGFQRVEGLALDSGAAVLYGSDTATAQLVAIDVSTGAASAVAQISGPLVWSGGAHVFRRSGAIWSEEAVLAASTPGHMELYGSALAVSGDTVVVGAPGLPYPIADTTGAAYVLVRSGSQWTEQAVLRASDGVLGDVFGASVAIDGDTILVGAPYDGHAAGVAAGSAYVFERQGGAWVESAKLVPATLSAGDQFGRSVALDGSRCLVGAPYTTIGWAEAAGVGYTFVQSGTGWSQEARLARKAFEFGVGLVGECYDQLGRSAALCGDTAVLGAPGYAKFPQTAVGVGAAWVYGLTAAGWTEKDRIKGPSTILQDYDGFGFAVAAEGDRVVAGALIEPVGGRANLFTPQFDIWKKQLWVVASDAAPGDDFGYSVSLSGDTLIAGAPFDDHAVGVDAGSAYVFRLAPPAPTVHCTAGTSASGCVALLSASGTPSANAPSGFTVSASGVEGSRTGMFIFGQGGKQALPWGGTSFQCAPPPLATSGPLPVTGTLGACDGAFGLDLNALWCTTCPKPAINPGEGSLVHVQLWYRDPLNPSGQTTSFSDAIELWVLP